MADAFGLHRRSTTATDACLHDAAWAWGHSLGYKQKKAEHTATRCVAITIGVVLTCLVAWTVFAPASDADYLVQAPEIAELYHPYGHQALEAVRDDTGSIAASFHGRKMHARLRRAMSRACHGHANASGVQPTYFMSTEFVLRSATQDNAIVRHFPYRMGCMCRFNECTWFEDPVVLHKNEHASVTFMCSDSVRDGNNPVKTIRALPYSVLNSDGQEHVAKTVEEACQMGMLVDVLAPK